MKGNRFLRLVEKARRGNSEAFCELMELRARKIVFMATSLMGNKTDGEDAAQEAVIAIGRDLSKLKKAESFDAWMYRVVFNVCMKEKKRKAVMQQETADLDSAAYIIPAEDEAANPEQSVQSVEERRAIVDAIERLPEHLRMCLILFYYENLSYLEIAEALKVSEQVVANNLYRAKAKLREMLGPQKELGFNQSKASALIPSVAITEAFALSEDSLITSATLAQIKDVAAAVALKRAALFPLAFFGNAGAKVAAVGLIVLVVGFFAAIQRYPSHEAPTDPVSEVAETTPSVPATQIISETEYVPQLVGQPPGSQTIMVMKDDASEAWRALQPQLDSLSLVKEGSVEGYAYYLYHAAAREGDQYVLVLEKTDAAAKPPESLRIEV